jgi:hypothetical protein
MLSTCLASFSQQKESSVSVSCYVNPELYLNAGIIAFVSNRAGNSSCKGNYITIYNGSKNSFYYRLSKTAKTWKEVKPDQQSIIPFSSGKTSSNIHKVNLNAKYSLDAGNNISLKLKAIAKMNTESDKVKARELKGNPAVPKPAESKPGKLTKVTKPLPAQPKEEEIDSKPGEEKLTVKPQIAKNKEAITRENIKTKDVENEITNTKDSALNSLNLQKNTCYYISDTAYYTFYYVKIRDTVLYSGPFPVEHYEDEEYGRRILSNAWGCLGERLIETFGESRYNQFLNDVDNDLMLGFQHLRNPQIPSEGIKKEYAYTASLTAAKAELEKWIKNDTDLNRNLNFIKINFP